MSQPGCRPVLLVEGPGDRMAIPLLVRLLFQHLGRPDCVPAPRPIRCGDLPKLARSGEVEKFVKYACLRPDGDSVLLVVDCDDDCPREVVAGLCQRVSATAKRFGKRVGLALMQREFETLFLYSLRELAERYPELRWTLEDPDSERDWTEIRGAKEKLGKRMSVGTYKETRDQARFVSALDLEALQERCRPFAHLASTLAWLSSDSARGHVYPHIRPRRRPRR